MSWYRMANTEQFLNGKLAELFGVYNGDWSERSVRRAGATITPAVDEQVGDYLRKNHPHSPFGGKSDTYGHWLLRDGSLTGQLVDHEESANNVLKSLPDYRRRVDGITDLMALAGVIRVRFANGRALVLDIVHKPTIEQLEKIAELGKSVEEKGGVVMWQVMNDNDTGTLYEGMDVDSLFEVPWKRLKAF